MHEVSRICYIFDKLDEVPLSDHRRKKEWPLYMIPIMCIELSRTSAEPEPIFAELVNMEFCSIMVIKRKVTTSIVVLE